MVVKMESGWDRVKAAAYSYSATAMPRLTGALVTVAGFMPIGFSKSTTRRIRGRHLLDRRHRGGLLVGGLGPLHAVPGREDAAEGPRASTRTAAIPTTRRSTASSAGLIDLALERRWWVIGATVAALALALFGMRFVPQQFFPNSSRPELIVELRLKEGASFAATTEQVKKMEAILAKDEDVALLHRVHRRRRAALLPVAQSGAAEPGLRAVHRDDEGPGGARARALAADGRGARASSRRRGCASRASSSGPPVGFPVQFRVVGPDTQKVRDDRARGRARRGRRARRCATCSSTGTIRCAR